MGKCPNCARTTRDKEVFCNDCGEPLFASGGTLDVEPKEATPDQYASGGFAQASGRYGPTAGYGRAAAGLPPPKKSSYSWIWVAFTGCVVLGLAVAAIVILAQPRIKVDPPPGWVVASEAQKSEFNQGMEGEGSLIEMFVTKNNAAVLIAIGKVDTSSMGDMPDTGDLEEMQEYLVNNRDEIEQEFAEPGIKLEEVEARQLACGQSALLLSLGIREGSIYATEDMILAKKGSTVFMVMVANGAGSINVGEVEYLVENIRFE